MLSPSTSNINDQMVLSQKSFSIFFFTGQVVPEFMGS